MRHRTQIINYLLVFSLLIMQIQPVLAFYLAPAGIPNYAFEDIPIEYDALVDEPQAIPVDEPEAPIVDEQLTDPQVDTLNSEVALSQQIHPVAAFCARVNCHFPVSYASGSKQMRDANHITQGDDPAYFDKSATFVLWHFDRRNACIVLDLGGWVKGNNIQLYVDGYRSEHRVSTNVDIKVSDTEGTCDTGKWSSWYVYNNNINAIFDRCYKNRRNQCGVKIKRVHSHPIQRRPDSFRYIKINITRNFGVQGVHLYNIWAVPGHNGHFEPASPVLYNPGNGTHGENTYDPNVDADTAHQTQVWAARNVNPRTGTYSYGVTDITTQNDGMPLNFRRFYLSANHVLADNLRDATSLDFGAGWSHNFNARLMWTDESYDEGAGEGSEEDAEPSPTSVAVPSTPATPTDPPPTLTPTPSPTPVYPPDPDTTQMWYVTTHGAVHRLKPGEDTEEGDPTFEFETGFLGDLEYLGEAGETQEGRTVHYRLIVRDQTIYYFDEEGYLQVISQMRRRGDDYVSWNPIVLTYENLPADFAPPDSLPEGVIAPTTWRRLKEIVSGNNKLTFTYDTSGAFIKQIMETVPAPGVGRSLSYEYGSYMDGDGGSLNLLRTARDVMNQPWTYVYENVQIVGQADNPEPEASWKLTQVSDPLNRVVEKQAYCGVEKSPSDTGSLELAASGQTPPPPGGAPPPPTQSTTAEVTPPPPLAGTYQACGDVSDVVELSPLHPARWGGVYQQWDGAGQLIARFEYLDQTDGKLRTQVYDQRGNALIYDYLAGKSLHASYLNVADDRHRIRETLFHESHARLREVLDANGDKTTYIWSGNGHTREETIYCTAGVPCSAEAYRPVTEHEDTYNLLVKSSFSPTSGVAWTLEDLATTYKYNFDPAAPQPQAQYPTLPWIIEDPVGRHTTFIYDAQGHLKSMTNRAGTVTTYADYHAPGKPQTIIVDPSGVNGQTQMKYDAYGRVTQVIEYHDTVIKRRTIIVYNKRDQVVKTIANATTGTATCQQPPAVADENVCTWMKYDQAGNLIEGINPLGEKTTYTYTLAPGVKQITEVKNDTQGSFTANHPGQNIRVVSSLDGRGQVIKVEEAAVMYNATTFTPTAGTRTHLTCYNGLGLPERQIRNASTLDACGAVAATGHDDQNVIRWYEYDNNGNLLRICEDTDRSRDAYDPETNVHDRCTTYKYDAVNRQTQITENWLKTQDGHDTGRITSINYDFAGNLEKVTYPDNTQTHYCYDVLNQQRRMIVNLTGDHNCARPVTSRSSGDNHDQDVITEYQYTPLGQVAVVIDPLGHRAEYDYDKAGRLIRTATNVIRTDNANSELTRTCSTAMDQNKITEYQYDDLGRVLKLQEVLDSAQTPWSGARGRLTTFTYDGLDRQQTVTDNATPATVCQMPGGTSSTQRTTYDALGRVTQVTDPTGKVQVYDYKYQAIGNQVAVYTPGFPVTYTRYDPVGNVMQSVAPPQRETRLAYDGLNRPVAVRSPLSHITTSSYRYDQATKQQVITHTDAAGVQTQLRYDRLGRLVTVHEDATGLNRQTQYQYDAAGDLKTVTLPSGDTITYGYDKLHRRTIEDGLLAGEADKWITRYNALGQIQNVKPPNNNATGITYNYDGLNRLESIDYPQAQTADVLYNYDALGRLTQMKEGVLQEQAIPNPLRQTTYSYDSLMNRVNTITDPFNRAITYAYDAAGRRQTVDMPGEPVMNYDYDGAGRLATVTSWGSNAATIYGYDTANRLQTVTLPNKVVATYTYDDDNRLDQLTYKKDGELVIYDYNLDEVGQVEYVVESVLVAIDTPIATPTNTPTPTSTPTNTPTPTHTPTLTPTHTPTYTPTHTPVPPPVARINAPSPWSVRATNGQSVRVRLDGTSSTSSIGIRTYIWQLGNQEVARGATPTITVPVGQHTVTLIVEDNQDRTHTVNKPLTVVANQAPVAAINVPPSVRAPNGSSVDIALNAAGSRDADGQIVRYSWSLAGKTATGANPTISAVPVGNHTIILTVTDNEGRTHTVNKPLTVVANRPPTIQIHMQSDYWTNAATALVQFAGSATDDVGVRRWWWTVDGAKQPDNTHPKLSLAIGRHSAWLSAQDHEGRTHQVEKTFTVRQNQAPAARITQVTSKYYYQGVHYALWVASGAEIQLGGSWSDLDGSVVRHQWKIGNWTSSAASPKRRLTAGTHLIQLTVTDNRGRSTTTSQRITVGNLPLPVFTPSDKSTQSTNPVAFTFNNRLPYGTGGQVQFWWNPPNGPAVETPWVSPTAGSYSCASNGYCILNACLTAQGRYEWAVRSRIIPPVHSAYHEPKLSFNFAGPTTCKAATLSTLADADPVQSEPVVEGDWMLNGDMTIDGSSHEGQPVFFASTASKQIMNTLTTVNAFEVAPGRDRVTLAYKADLSVMDAFAVEVLPAGADAWQPLVNQPNLNTDWTRLELDLRDYTGQQIQLQVRTSVWNMDLPQEATSVGVWFTKPAWGDAAAVFGPYQAKGWLSLNGWQRDLAVDGVWRVETTTPDVDLILIGASALSLTEPTQMRFWQTADLLESDQVLIQVRPVGDADWTTLYQLQGLQQDWGEQTLDLSAYTGQTVDIRFVMTKHSAADTTSRYAVYEPLFERLGETVPTTPDGMTTTGVDAPPIVIDPAWATQGGWTPNPDLDAVWMADVETRPQTITLHRTYPLALTGTVNPQLTFWHAADLSSVDTVSIEVSTDNLTWTPLYQQTALKTSDWVEQTLSLNGYENSRLWLRVRLDMTGTVPPGETAGGYWIIEPHLRPAPVAGVQAQPKSPTHKMVPLDLARVALQVTPPPVEPEEPPESDESAAVVPKALIEPASEPEEVEPEAVNAANPFLSADPVTTTTRTIIYQYDDLYRVTKATYCDGAYTKANPCTTPTHEYVYTYDENGNRKTETITGAGLSSVNNVFNYNVANQLTTATINGTGYTYTYDNNGNLTNDGTTTYTYDAADRLITLANGTNTYTYTYNGLGDRLSQAVTGGSTTQYLLDLNANLTQVLSEYTQGATTPDVNYLHGHDIIGQQRGTTWHYFGTDGLGSNRFMTNNAGALTYSALYDPYGQVLSAVGPGNTNLGFTGEHTDPTGLQYLRARYYDPRTAAFLSRDPVRGFVGGQSIRWNPYIYAGANPVNYTDPSGQFPWLAAAAVGLWFARGAAVDIGMQVVLEGRGLHNLDLRSAAISGVIDVGTGGLGTYAKGLGYGARTVNRLDFAADVALSATADYAFYDVDPLTALASNTIFGAGGRVGFHQAGRALYGARRQLGNIGGNIQLLGAGSNPVEGSYISRQPTERMVNQEWGMSCVAACTRQMFRNLGEDVDEATVRHFLRTHEKTGTIWEILQDVDIERITKGTSLEGSAEFRVGAIGDEITLQHIEQLEGMLTRWNTVIVQLGNLEGGRSYHAVIVDSVNIEEGYIRLLDPYGLDGPGITGTGTVGTMNLESFRNRWDMGMGGIILGR